MQIRSIFSKVFLTLALVSNWSMADQKTDSDFMRELNEKYPYTKGAVVAPAFGDFYSVSKPNEVLFVNKDMSIMISGNVFDLIGEKSLTGELLEKNKPRLRWSDFDLSKAIKIGSGEKKILIFSDPDCPFCQKLERELSKIESELTVYVAPLPLVGLHPNAQKVADRIWCSKNKAQAWRDYMLLKKQPAQLGCSTPTSEWIEIAGANGINSTPTIILPDGSMIPGAQTADQIKKLVGLK
jgi:thiol:disulfide interchange protein DsbC